VRTQQIVHNERRFDGRQLVIRVLALVSIEESNDQVTEGGGHPAGYCRPRAARSLPDRARTSELVEV
jgi:hypothetical protein